MACTPLVGLQRRDDKCSTPLRHGGVSRSRAALRVGSAASRICACDEHSHRPDRKAATLSNGAGTQRVHQSPADRAGACLNLPYTPSMSRRLALILLLGLLATAPILYCAPWKLVH